MPGEWISPGATATSLLRPQDAASNLSATFAALDHLLIHLGDLITEAAL